MKYFLLSFVILILLSTNVFAKYQLEQLIHNSLTGGSKIWLDDSTLATSYVYGVLSASGFSLYSSTSESLRSISTTGTGISTIIGSLSSPYYAYPNSSSTVVLYNLDSQTKIGSGIQTSNSPTIVSIDGQALQGAIAMGTSGTKYFWWNETTIHTNVASTMISSSLSAANGLIFIGNLNGNAAYIYDPITLNQQAISNPDPTSCHSFGYSIAASMEDDLFVVGCPNGNASGSKRAFAFRLKGTAWTMISSMLGDIGFGKYIAVSPNGQFIALASDSFIRIYLAGSDTVTLATELTVPSGEIIKDISIGDDGEINFIAILTDKNIDVYSINLIGSSSSLLENSNEDNKWNTLWIPLICGLGGGLILIAVIAVVAFCCCKHRPQSTKKNDMLFTDIAMEDHTIRS